MYLRQFLTQLARKLIAQFVKAAFLTFSSHDLSCTLLPLLHEVFMCRKRCKPINKIWQHTCHTWLNLQLYSLAYTNRALEISKWWITKHPKILLERFQHRLFDHADHNLENDILMLCLHYFKLNDFSSAVLGILLGSKQLTIKQTMRNKQSHS